MGTVCLEEISDRNVNTEGVVIMNAFFNKAVAERDLREKLIDSLSKLFKSHPKAKALKKFLTDACYSGYENPKSKKIAKNTMHFIATLVRRRLIEEDIVHQILEETRFEQASSNSSIKVELWLKLIELLKDSVDTSGYLSNVARYKSTMSARIRFAIMALEELQRNNWNPRM